LLGEGAAFGWVSGKIRNVQDKLPQHLRGPVGTKMRAAYHADSALLAQAQLQALARELDKTHPRVAASLREGLAETLTVLRLGVPPTLARTLRSTNAIESMIGVCRQRSANVKRWRDGDMAMRWCAAGMVEAGKQFRRVNGHLHLASLRAALEREAAESVGATCHDDLVFMWSDRPRARRSPARVADLIAAFGARRAGLRLAAAAISVTAAG